MNNRTAYIGCLLCLILLTIVITGQASHARPSSALRQIDVIQAPPRDPFPAATFTLTPTTTLTPTITPTPTTTPTVMPSFTPDASHGTVDTIGEANGNFNVFLAAVEATGLVDALNAEGPLTIFAPSDEAFVEMLEALGLSAEELLADTETLTNILLYHVVAGEFAAEDVIQLDGEMVPTLLSGAEIAISVENGIIFLNETVMVVLPNVFASNGIIHVIYGVLLPPPPDHQREIDAQNTQSSQVTLAQATANAEALATVQVSSTTSSLSDLPLTTGPLTLAPDENKRIEIGIREEHQWTLVIGQERRVSIQVISDNFGQPDLYLAVFDSNNRLLASDDDSGGNLNPLIPSFPVRQNAQYTLVVSSLGRGAGTYVISVDRID